MAFGDFARLDDWMLPPQEPAAPAPSVRDVFRMGGLADLTQYVEAHPEQVFGDYDKRAAKRQAFEALPEIDQKPLVDLSGGVPLDEQIEQDKELAKFFVPTTPLDAGLMVAGGPVGGKLAKTAAVGLGALLNPGDAEAGARDPRLWSAISRTKLRKPLDEMEHRYTDARNPVPKFVQPEDLVGGYGIFTPWDLSAANKTLTHVDALKLADPVRLHGGVGFPEANPGMAAASEAPISRGLDNQAMALTERTGKPVYIMPMTMSPQGIDASHHVADPLSQLLQTAKITTKDAKAFDEVMRENVPNWVGVKSDKFRDYINDLKGGMTTKALMANRMALAEWQAKGFPDVAAVRHAASEPALIEMPRNTTGMAISKYIPGQGLLETTHPSYSKGVAGQHMGQLASLIPFEAAAPSIAEGLARVNAANKALGKKVAIQPRYHMEKPTKGVPVEQYFDEQWAENIRRLWGDIK